MKRVRSKSAREMRHCDILILTGSVGSGHLSVSKALSEAIYRVNGKKVSVEVMDLMTTFANIVTMATKNIYLSFLKISPKIYELLFYRSSESEWPLKILNALGAPFMQEKLLEILREKKPRVLVSTYPIWDFLLKKVWKKYSRPSRSEANLLMRRRRNLQGRYPFVTVITDSVNVHSSWTHADANYFLVANEDTKVALKNHGIAEKRIRVFGYPIAHEFSVRHSCEDFQQKWNLSPKRKTLLLILSTGVRWAKIKKLIAVIQKSRLKKVQLIIVAAGDDVWKEKLEQKKWPWPTRITGFSNEMHSIIHGADIVLTKAGGATVMECIESQKPMVIIEAIPGQEIGNAMFIQKYNLGVVLNRDLENFDEAIEYVWSHETLIKKNLASQQKPNAAENAAKFLTKLL